MEEGVCVLLRYFRKAMDYLREWHRTFSGNVADFLCVGVSFLSTDSLTCIR